MPDHANLVIIDNDSDMKAQVGEYINGDFVGQACLICFRKQGGGRETLEKTYTKNGLAVVAEANEAERLDQVNAANSGGAAKKEEHVVMLSNQ